MIVNDPLTRQQDRLAPAIHGSPGDATIRRRKPWFRRPRRAIPVGVLFVAMIAAAIIGYRTMAAFETVQSLSTPPPQVSGALLGGADDIAIDTGPAQEAVRQRQAEERTPQQTPAASGDNGAANRQTAPATEKSTEPTPVGQGPTAAATVVDARPGQATQPDPGVPTAAPSDQPAVAGAPTTSDGGTTFLLMGVDARSGESIDVGVRPDALAVLHLEDDGSCRMLAVPRDSRATLPGYGFSKINHALAIGGIPYEIQVVEEYLGIEIDHYGLVDFGGITQIVDSVGGIDVDNPEAFTVGDQTFAPGPISLDGERALMYARYRGGADGDFGRIAKQQQVMRAVLDRARDLNLVRFVPSSFSLLADHIRTDLGPATIVDLGAQHLDACTAQSLQTSTIPGDVATLYDDLLQMQLSFVVSDPAQVRERIDWLLTGQ